jgi:hypothetical protein
MGVPKATPKAPPRKPGRPAIYPQEPPAVRAAREAKQKAAADAIMKQLNPGNNFGIQDPYALQNLLASAGKVKTNATPAKTNTAANTSNTAAANAAVTTPSVSNTAGSSRGGMSNRPASTPHPNMGAQTTPGSTRTKTQPTGGGARQETLIPNTKDLPPLSQKDYDELLALYKEAEKYPDVKNPATEKFQRRYHELAGDYARAVLASEPVTSHGQRGGLTNKDLESNVDAIFGKRTKQYLAALNKPVPEKPKDVPADVPADTPVAPPDEEGVYETSPYRKYGWENLAAQVLPWLKKTPGEPLLGDQLAGEMFALSHNQVEPVQARFFHPQLDVPYDISYQDRLNENQATFNALQRAAGAGNPEALSMLAGQKYGADSNVLAEQFRANQAKKDQVYSQNRATMNQAMMTNLGLADQQYVRQQQAKSNTKLATQEALNSIAAKIGQNRLENRTLQTYANMFPDFSYGKDYNIRKTGAPTSLNMPVLYNAAGDITHVGLYDNDGKLYDYKELTPAEQKEMSKSKKPPLAGRGIVADNATTTATQKATARNGSLVRAFRDI